MHPDFLGMKKHAHLIMKSTLLLAIVTFMGGKCSGDILAYFSTVALTKHSVCMLKHLQYKDVGTQITIHNTLLRNFFTDKLHELHTIKKSNP
jgi:hypothetical protein